MNALFAMLVQCAIFLLFSGDVDVCVPEERIFISSGTDAKTDLYALPDLVSHENRPCFFIWAGKTTVHSSMIYSYMDAFQLVSCTFLSHRLPIQTDFTFPSTLRFDTIC